MSVMDVKKCFLIFTVLLVQVGFARAETSEETMRTIASEFMSPFCPGRVLSDCPSSAASELKAKILADLQKGKSRAEIEDVLLAQYGDASLAAPRFSGFGLVSWLGPIVFLVVGLLGAAIWSQRVKVVEKAEPPLTEEERRRIEKNV
jgi:cytochrome c-type biogenesis protein CcmH/NrfF